MAAALPSPIAIAPLDDDADERRIVLLAIYAREPTATAVPLKYRSDREIMLAAVQEKGLALRFASAELQGDRELVMDLSHLIHILHGTLKV